MGKNTKEIEELRARIDALEAADEEAAEGVEPSEETIKAGQALAKAISDDIGIEMPVGEGQAGGCGILELPREFVQNGGVAVFAIVSPPEE